MVSAVLPELPKKNLLALHKRLDTSVLLEALKLKRVSASKSSPRAKKTLLPRTIRAMRALSTTRMEVLEPHLP